MTDKLHCPVCGAELETEDIWATPICPNKSCRYYGIKIPEEIWQALIEGKKAQDALKEIVANPHGAACHNYQRAKKALEGK